MKVDWLDDADADADVGAGVGMGSISERRLLIEILEDAECFRVIRRIIGER